MKAAARGMALSALLALSAAAQAGKLVVSVLDKDGKPVQDAVVVVTPAGKGALPKNPLPATSARQISVFFMMMLLD